MTIDFNMNDPERMRRAKTTEHDEMVLWLHRRCKSAVGQNATFLHELFIHDPYVRRAASDARRSGCPLDEALGAWMKPIASVDCTMELPVRSGRYLHGFIDLFAIVDIEGGGRVALAFECKSHVDGIGDLIRQIRRYQTQIERVGWVVVGKPDPDLAAILNDQRIGFLPYNPEADHG